MNHTKVEQEEHDRGIESINLAVLRFPSRCSATMAHSIARSYPSQRPHVRGFTPSASPSTPPPPSSTRPSISTKAVFLDHIADGPQHPLLILLHTNIIIRTYHIEPPLSHLLLQISSHLLGPPSPLRLLFLLAPTRQPRMGPPRHQQMDARLSLTLVTAQTLGERFERGFRGVVGGIAGRVGNALL